MTSLLLHKCLYFVHFGLTPTLPLDWDVLSGWPLTCTAPEIGFSEGDVGTTDVRDCKLGKARSLHSRSTQRSLPLVRLNLRVRDGGEGSK